MCSARINVVGLALLIAPAAICARPWPAPDWQQASNPEQVGISRSSVSAHLGWLGAKAGPKPWGIVLIRNDGMVLLPDVPGDAFYHVGNARESRRTVLLIVLSFDLVAVVGAEAGAYDITRDYARRPAANVNEWAARVAATVIRRP